MLVERAWVIQITGMVSLGHYNQLGTRNLLGKQFGMSQRNDTIVFTSDGQGRNFNLLEFVLMPGNAYRGNRHESSQSLG